MKELKLGGKLGLYTLVDDEDYHRISALPWYPHKSEMNNGDISTYYVMGRNGMILHRYILGITDSTIHVDHKNRNGLDNQKHNLRTCTQGQNLANRPKAKKNSSGFKGAYKSGNRWTSLISINNKLKHLGTFNSPEEAAKAYDKAALEQWGEFACLNF